MSIFYPHLKRGTVSSMRKNLLSFAFFAFQLLLFIAVVSLLTLVILETTIPIPYFFLPFVICPLLILATMVVGNLAVRNRLNELLYTVSIFWIPILFYLLLGAACIGIASLLSLPPTVLQILTAIIYIKVILVLLYGTWNARSIRIKNYSVDAPLLKENWGDKKIVLISDVHLGMVLQKKWTEKIVRKINELSPDIVFIAGDLIDGPLVPYEKDLAPLGNLKSTYGVFYTAGNHDEYNREQEKYYAALTKHVTVLNDEKIIVNNTQIIGLIYTDESHEETKNRLQKTGYEKNKPAIAMLHDPKNIPALVDMQVPLTLSGHTHGGQFFPLNLIVNRLYKKLARGHHQIGETAHITSVGVGTAGPPFRLGTEPEIVVITIA
jgi:predicted MPP superfamily phosphohydrolase